MIYKQGDAELVYGQFRNSLPPPVKDHVFAATKWCVFGPIGRPVTNTWVLEAVKERCRRLGGRVELLQFHWYDVSDRLVKVYIHNERAFSNVPPYPYMQYSAKEYLDILAELISITKTHPELVSTIGLCNFDSAHVQEACDYLIEKNGAVGLVSNQIQVLIIRTTIP